MLNTDQGPIERVFEESGSEMNLQRVRWAMIDLVVMGSLVFMGEVVVGGPLLLGYFVGLWACGGHCGQADVLGLGLVVGEVGGLGIESLAWE